MKKLVPLSLILLILSCKDQDIELPPPIDHQIEERVAKEDLPDTTNPLSSVHPSNLSPDKSWMVELDVQEGFFMSYTITYQTGKELTVPYDKSIPIIGGVDHPSPVWIDNNTYKVPHIGGSKKGYFELLIFKDGNCEYIEHQNE